MSETGRRAMIEPAASTLELEDKRSKGDQELVAEVPLGHLGPPAHHMTPHGACIPTTIWKTQGPG